MTVAFICFDSPVESFSSLERLQAWLAEIRTWEQTKEVRDEIEQVEYWIELKTNPDAVWPGERTHDRNRMG